MLDPAFTGSQVSNPSSALSHLIISLEAMLKEKKYPEPENLVALPLQVNTLSVPSVQDRAFVEDVLKVGKVGCRSVVKI